jgi:hypothetical protein
MKIFGFIHDSIWNKLSHCLLYSVLPLDVYSFQSLKLNLKTYGFYLGATSILEFLNYPISIPKCLLCTNNQIPVSLLFTYILHMSLK